MRTTLVLALALLLGGCASTEPYKKVAGQVADNIEKRQKFYNDAVDKSGLPDSIKKSKKGVMEADKIVLRRAENGEIEGGDE